jgi:hypothetical protein
LYWAIGIRPKEARDEERTHADPGWPGAATLREVRCWKTSPVQGIQGETSKVLEKGYVPYSAQGDVEHQILGAEELGDVACCGGIACGGCAPIRNINRGG